MSFIEKMFTNECEKGEDGFEEKGYQIFFVVWIIVLDVKFTILLMKMTHILYHHQIVIIVATKIVWI